MIFKALALLSLCSPAAAQFPAIAGYLPRSNATEYLVKDLIQKELEDLIGDETCVSFDLADDFYNNGDGRYFSEIPTYQGSESESYKEYTKYYGKDDFVNIWAKNAIKKTKTKFTRGNADFAAAFPTNTTGAGDCVGFEEVLKKGLSYTGTIAELLQLGQKAYDEALNGCSAQPPNTCVNAIEAWDGAVAIYVGSLEGTDGTNDVDGDYGKAPYTLADKRCRNYKNCGPTRAGETKDITSSINTKVLALFAAGSHAAWNGDHILLAKYIRLISNKVAVPLIQGAFRYYYRLSDDEFGPNTFSNLDKEVGEGGAFIFGLLPKLWACSTRGVKKAEAQTKVGGGVVGVSAVNFQDIRLAFECNYRCLGVTCAEVGSLYDGDATVKPGATACDDESNGSENTCSKTKGSRKQSCKLFTGKPGVKGRDKIRF
jgi:hypothetical protein